MGKKWKQWQTSFSWAPKSLWTVTAAMQLKDVWSLEENLDSILKSRDISLLSGQSYGFSSSHVQMSELDHKEGWRLKNWCFWSVVLVKTLESPLVNKEIKLVHPKGRQPWIFTGSTDAEAETLILWLPAVKSWLFGKDWFWERLKAGGEGDDTGWHGWMASSSQWTWVRANSGRQRTGKTMVLQTMGSQRVGHDWVTANSNNTEVTQQHLLECMF